MSIQTYEGALKGLSFESCELAVIKGWNFEGRTYDTPATEGDVMAEVAEGMSEPDAHSVGKAHELLFRCSTTHTGQALTALARAYETEVGEGGEAVDPVVAILLEAARRISVIEALTV